ncbi:FAD-dependent oxidoreductase [Agromyces tardus]|uniref:FAD-dependent oxidoreductase n=1 Tax=Agromyces tardus TaxID=2583849 RepID=UPI002678D3CB
MTPSGTDTEVVVVGGGAMGSSAAWHLARRGREVTLLERFDPGHAHGASHGASRNFNLAYSEPTHVAMLLESQLAWRELEAETGASLLAQVGLVDHGDDAGHEEVRDALGAVGIPSESVPAEAARRRWPGIRFETRALYLPTAGRLHADAAVRAFQQAAAARGAVVRHRTPVRASASNAAIACTSRPTPARSWRATWS